MVVSDRAASSSGDALGDVARRASQNGIEELFHYLWVGIWTDQGRFIGGVGRLAEGNKEEAA
jgi:hypothetical protein